MKYVNNSNEFLDLFGDIQSSGYVNPISLTDTKIGFSVQRQYSANIGFIPAKTKNGENDDIAVIWVVYESIAEDRKEKKVPIRLRIAKMSKYRAKNWDYDFSDENSPTKESVTTSKESIQPLEFSCIDEYYYDASKKSLVDKQGGVVLGSKILDELFGYHCKSSHPVKGLMFRAKNTVELKRVQAYDSIIKSIKYVLNTFFGRTLDDQFNRFSYDGYLLSDFKKTADSVLEVASYKASKKVIILFLVSAIIFCLTLLPTKNLYIKSVLDSEFLTVIHSLLALIVLDELVPLILFYLLNKTISGRKNYLNKLLSRGRV